MRSINIKLGLLALFVCGFFFASADQAAAAGTLSAQSGSNNQTQINVALASGGVVHLNAGTYTISDTIVLKSGNTLEGDAGAKIVLVSNANWPRNKNMIEGRSVSNVHIKGFEVDGNRANNTTSTSGGSVGEQTACGKYFYTMIYFVSSTNIEVDHMTLHHNWNDILKFSRCTTVSFHDNTVRQPGHDVVYAIGSSDVKVYNNFIRIYCNSGVRPDGTKNIDIYNNDIARDEGAGGYAGIEIQGESTVRICNNNIHDTKGGSIVDLSSGKATISYSGCGTGTTPTNGSGGTDSGGSDDSGGGGTTGGTGSGLDLVFAYTISDDTASAVATGLTSGFTYEGTPGQGWSTLTGAGLKIVSGYGTQVSCGYQRYLGDSVSCSSGALSYDQALSKWRDYLQSSAVQSNLGNIVGFALSDDWYNNPGAGKKLFQDMTAAVHQYAPGHRSICIVTANTSYAHSASSYASFAAAQNFSPAGCDMVGIYLYPTVNNQPFTNFTNAIAGLKLNGLDTAVTPVIGIAESYNTTGTAVENEVKYMCDNGASSIGFWAYNTGLGTAAAESEDIRGGMSRGIQYCGGAVGGGGGTPAPIYWYPTESILDPSPYTAINLALPAEEQDLDALFPSLAAAPTTATAECTDQAGSAGFIPCGRHLNDPDTSWNECSTCGLCSLVLMAQLTIEFLVRFSAVAATLAIVIGGFRYILAAGRQDQVAKAKSMIQFVLVGFIIIFVAWTAVDTLLTVFGYIDPVAGEWYTAC